MVILGNSSGGDCTEARSVCYAIATSKTDGVDGKATITLGKQGMERQLCK